MSDRREEVRKTIREVGREKFLLDEMQRLGFWPREAGEPTVQEELINRESELRRELRKLTAEQSAQKNVKAQLRKLRQERMKAARQRRAETKARREEERLARAAAWEDQQSRDITYLGEDVSYGLRNAENDEEKLRENNLPAYADLPALAKDLGLSVSKIRWLAFNRSVSTVSHYRQFTMPKKTGGVRHISAPMPLLKTVQHWLLENILYRMDVTDKAHGFVPGRGILTNALPHVGKTLVVNLDLQNFFPTISYRRVKGFFRAVGYSEKLATVFALLCTEPATDLVEADGKKYYVQTGERALPQGAPSSPVLTNLICRRLDARLSGVATKFGLTYTRYADDLTFSGDDAEHGASVGKLLWQVRQIIKDEGFVVHPGKTQVMRKGARREVTGIVVNEKPSIARKKLRQFRAVLHQIDRHGPAGKTWGKGGSLFPALHGYAAHVNLVRPDLGPQFLARVEELWQRYDPDYRTDSERGKERQQRKLARSRVQGNGIEQGESTQPLPSAPDVPTTPPPQPAPKKKPWWKRLFP